MLRAHILGAGASYGSTLPKALRPPLVKSFFSKAWEQGMRTNTFPELIQWLKTRFAINKTSLKNGSWNYEQALSLADVEHQFGVAFHGDLEAAMEIHVRRKRLLEVAEDTLLGSSIYCEHGTCASHERIVATLTPGDIIINFNYDVIADASLRRAGKLNEDAPWLLGIPFSHAWGNREFRRLRRRSNWEESNSYFKLHGAVNWFRGTGFQDGGRRGARARRRVYVPIEFLDRGHIPTSGILQSTEGNIHVEPMIVPPSFMKGNLMAGEKPDWSGLWWRCADRLAKCKKWIFIGFSCGHSDVDAHWLLRRAAVLARRPELEIADLDPDSVKQRLGTVLRGIPVTWGRTYTSLQEYAGALT